MHSLSPQKHSKFQWLAWLDYISMWYPQVTVIAAIQQQLNAGVGEQLLLPQETSAPRPAQPAPAGSASPLRQMGLTSGPGTFKDLWAETQVMRVKAHAISYCLGTQQRVGRTEKVSLTGHRTTVAGYRFWDKNWSGLPRIACSIYADPGPNVLRLEQDVRNFRIILQKLSIFTCIKKVWNKLYNNQAESTRNPVPQEIPVTVHRYLCYHPNPSTCRMYV